MSANDDDWSVFWSCGSSRHSPPSSSILNMGKHVGENIDKSQNSETIGYIVVESGTTQIDGYQCEVYLTSDSAVGIGNGGSQYASSIQYGLPLVSQAGMGGSDGSWAVLHGSAPLNNGQLQVGIDEDQIAAPERSHIT